MRIDLYNIQNEGGIDIKIENEAESRIISYAPARSHMNAFTLKGGEFNPVSGRSNLKFSPVSLDSQNWASRNFITILNEYDYVSLEPGKFEQIEFLFMCNEPGIYEIEIIVNVAYIGDSSTIEIISPELNCPESFTLWEIQSDDPDDIYYLWWGNQNIDNASLEILNLGEFVLENGQYIPKP